jgi:aryl-alcohol dehydrogenase-like predicted oxidoreductase
MQKRQLGNSDLHITPIGFGAWAIGGGGWAFGWGEQDDRDSIRAIHEALDTGINWIDTAPVYGLGRSEEVIARALAGRNPCPYVFTKCERVWNEKREIGRSLKATSIRQECEASLRRLKRDVIDLYQIHWPEPEEDVDEGWTTLSQLQKEGKVHWIGVSNFNVNQLKRIESIAPITSLQPPYSMVRPEVEAEILPYAASHNLGVIAYSPMASGLLTGAMSRERIAALPADDWRRNNKNYQEPLLTRNLRLVELLKTISKEYHQTVATVAIAWVLRNPAITGAIVGARRPGQVRDFIAAASWRIPDEPLQIINRFLRENIS